MKQEPMRVKWNGDEPAVTQGECNGWMLSWNPDDGKFHVGDVNETKARFAEWRNAVQYARTHSRN